MYLRIVEMNFIERLQMILEIIISICIFRDFMVSLIEIFEYYLKQ